MVPWRDAGVDGAEAMLMKPKPDAVRVSTWPVASGVGVCVARALVAIGLGSRARLKIFVNSARTLKVRPPSPKRNVRPIEHEFFAGIEAMAVGILQEQVLS